MLIKEQCAGLLNDLADAYTSNSMSVWQIGRVLRNAVAAMKEQSARAAADPEMSPERKDSIATEYSEAIYSLKMAYEGLLEVERERQFEQD